MSVAVPSPPQSAVDRLRHAQHLRRQADAIELQAIADLAAEHGWTTPSLTEAAAQTPSSTTLAPNSGKKCPECGAHEMHKVDGCLKCANSGAIGSCG